MMSKMHGGRKPGKKMEMTKKMDQQALSAEFWTVKLSLATWSQ